MLYVGVACALAAAVANSCVDGSRKYASSLVPSSALVALPALFEAALAFAAITSCGGFTGIDLREIPNPWRFALVTFLSSALQCYAKLLYQRALALAPLSLTVPYLSCTPGTGPMQPCKRPGRMGMLTRYAMQDVHDTFHLLNNPKLRYLTCLLPPSDPGGPGLRLPRRTAQQPRHRWRLRCGPWGIPAEPEDGGLRPAAPLDGRR